MNKYSAVDVPVSAQDHCNAESVCLRGSHMLDCSNLLISAERYASARGREPAGSVSFKVEFDAQTAGEGELQHQYST